MILTEVCCASLEDCLTAKQAGADRIELVSAHALGGLTPSLGLLRFAATESGLPVCAIVRPRMSAFCYSPEDFRVMCSDGKDFMENGAAGLVFGFLQPDGQLDYDRTARFCEITGEGDKVFHRAFDIVKNPHKTMETLISLGVTRVLTSGQRDSALEGADLIADLQRMYGHKIQILAGGGVKAHNAVEILEKTGVQQLHFGGTQLRQDPSALSGAIHFGPVSGNQKEDYPAVDLHSISAIIKSIK